MTSTPCLCVKGVLVMKTTHYFAFERLDAYRHAKEVLRLVAQRKRQLSSVPGKSGEQIHRAAVGAFTNLCSAAGQHGAEQKRQFRIAYSEANELAGALGMAAVY